MQAVYMATRLVMLLSATVVTVITIIVVVAEYDFRDVSRYKLYCDFRGHAYVAAH